MAFSVVSAMDGSMFGSRSASKRKSPGSNRAGGGEEQKKKNLNVKNNNNLSACQIYQPTVEAQQEGETHLPPTTTAIYTTQEVMNHGEKLQQQVSRKSPTTESQRNPRNTSSNPCLRRRMKRGNTAGGTYERV